jgi:hypothetical protein
MPEEFLKVYFNFFQGITKSYCYLGSFSSCFPLHTEDLDLGAINFLHSGKPKIWIIISKDAQKMEKIVVDTLQQENLISEPCNNIFRHKDYILTPEFLNQHNIEYQIIVQRPGEFVVTFPRGYHQGVNSGLNICESSNFANEEWVQYGRNGIQCSCSRKKNSGAPFDMSWFQDIV